MPACHLASVFSILTDKSYSSWEYMFCQVILHSKYALAIYTSNTTLTFDKAQNDIFRHFSSSLVSQSVFFMLVQTCWKAERGQVSKIQQKGTDGIQTVDTREPGVK